MSKALYIYINILIYWVLVTMITGLEVGSMGRNSALLLGGIIFAVVAFAVEPLLSFFKFPLNFWGLLVVGFILNIALFLLLSTGILPAVLVIDDGSIGDGFSPLPIPTIELASSLWTAVVSAIIATLLQILTRKLGK
jgi:uncharacterized membrane protein YvlD (DUF360 family)